MSVTAQHDGDSEEEAWSDAEPSSTSSFHHIASSRPTHNPTSTPASDHSTARDSPLSSRASATTPSQQDKQDKAAEREAKKLARCAVFLFSASFTLTSFARQQRNEALKAQLEKKRQAKAGLGAIAAV